jgi:hypothetical protein
MRNGAATTPPRSQTLIHAQDHEPAEEPAMRSNKLTAPRPQSETSRAILVEVVEYRNGKFKVYLGGRLLATSVEPFITVLTQ